MFIAQTTEQQKLLRWLEEQFQPDEIRSVETVAKNAVRIVDRNYDSTMVVCRQDGTIRLVRPDAEAC
ncbi:hypothetical protein AAAT94_00580 [Intestinimonas aquisgranensis]|uniref:hypothetical protein n=1 Tax=Intestinimonas timonensis TaxID=1689270 RepID=UPI001D0E6674|nr:hypothetical protein [Intestinimonas timonensis]MCC2258143.1 hypothetical protein [Intestinimonas aquisgranensis]